LIEEEEEVVEVMVFLLEMICDVNYIPLLFSRQRKQQAKHAKQRKEGGETLPHLRGEENDPAARPRKW